jgi:hypothetical protein
LGVGSHVGSSRSVVGVFFSEGCGPPGLAPDEAGAQAVCTPTRPDPQHHDPGRDLTRRLREADTRGLLSGKPTAREWVESLSRARPPRSPSDARPAVSLHPSEPGVDAPPRERRRQWRLTKSVWKRYTLRSSGAVRCSPRVSPRVFPLSGRGEDTAPAGEVGALLRRAFVTVASFRGMCASSRWADLGGGAPSGCAAATSRGRIWGLLRFCRGVFA